MENQLGLSIENEIKAGSTEGLYDLAGNEELEQKMDNHCIIGDYIRTTVRIHSFIPSLPEPRTTIGFHSVKTGIHNLQDSTLNLTPRIQKPGELCPNYPKRDTRNPNPGPEKSTLNLTPQIRNSQNS